MTIQKNSVKDVRLVKQLIIKTFIKNVKGRVSDTSKSNTRHDGRDGHWLETQMGVQHNADNDPDIDGFEMKNDTSSGKTTFGDWSADYYIFKDEVFGINRDQFLNIFGSPNPKKNMRPSWSGAPCPKIGKYNIFGQKLEVDKNSNILAIYNFKEDKRSNKFKIVPKGMQRDRLVLARWEMLSIKTKLEKKFNKLGWFKCLKDREGVYSSIVFGAPIKFDNWIERVKEGLVYFDSGMYQGNTRPYSQWRADNKYWDSLIIERY